HQRASVGERDAGPPLVPCLPLDEARDRGRLDPGCPCAFRLILGFKDCGEERMIKIHILEGEAALGIRPGYSLERGDVESPQEHRVIVFGLDIVSRKEDEAPAAPRIASDAVRIPG